MYKSRVKKVFLVLLTFLLIVPTFPISYAQMNSNLVYEETFSEQGNYVQSGGATLTLVENKLFTGNEDGTALYISNRSNNWDGVDFYFSELGLQDGKTYTINITGYVDESEVVPSGAQVYLQTVDKTYGWLASADLKNGESFTINTTFTLDMSKGDTRLRIQSNDNGKTVSFYVGYFSISTSDVGGEDGETPILRPPALPFEMIDFEDQSLGGFEGRAGTEKLTVTNEDNKTPGGSYALKVENRAQNWHGPSLRIEKYIDLGYEYTISLWVKLISPENAQIQLSTQVGSGSGASYNNILSKVISADDGWVLFEGKYRYNSSGGEYLTIYVESPNSSTASFYIDDVRLVKSGNPISVQKDLLPIKNVYESDFLIGSAVSAADLDGERLELLKLHYNSITAENAMKPSYLQPTKGNFTFEAADSIVNKAIEEGMKVHGHVLVWHQQTPKWMTTREDGSFLSREEALENLKNHIETVIKHFGNRVISWDVVNEAIIDNPPNPNNWEESLRKSPWYYSIGPDYVEQAFRIARQVVDENGWDIKLYYNDYNEDNQRKAQAIYHMVKELNEKFEQEHPGKKLIDGIGMQGHYSIRTNPDNVKMSLERFISLDVEISITELDIQAGTDNHLTEEQSKAQAYLYAKLFEMFKEKASYISRVTLWGLNDAASWRASTSPLLFDRNLQAKPSYYAVIDPDTFIQENPIVTEEARKEVALYGTPVIDGVVDSIWNGVPSIPIDRYQMAWQGASGTAKVLWDEGHLYV
ncbi:endo-1,4-beta-xylanase, partial [uncultured Anoxybacillus sp.]|uniref:endo-1,4-beta-xylanase n=1 Tax=uncultured Anoxybacillus sp. TaxID=263860 RepID=UPI002630809D